ncbi:beta strand repeat-containing protein [Methanobrevibacter sp.]|uniref:beta strand repeat-containing protein n=1 Tax=Methanobrevibacter sp. TaxID=66852 RepID=UPI00386BAB2A
MSFKLDKHVLLVLAVLMMLVMIPTAFASNIDDASAVGVNNQSAVDSVSAASDDIVVESVSQSAVDDKVSASDDSDVLTANYDYETYVTDPANSTVDYTKGDGSVKISVKTTYNYNTMSQLSNSKMYAYINGATNGIIVKSTYNTDVYGSAGTFSFYLTQFDDYLTDGTNTIIFHPDESYYGWCDPTIDTYNYQPLTVNIGGATPAVNGVYVDALDGTGGSGTSDDPYHSISDAYTNAADGVIIFKEGTYNFYDLYNPFTLNKDMEFVADGAVYFTSVNNNMFTVSGSSTTTTFRGINFVNATSSKGTIIYALNGIHGTLNFIDCNFVNNTGNCLVYSSCAVNLERCNFIDNELKGTSTTGNYGSGIIFFYESDATDIQYCNFIGNTIKVANQAMVVDWDQSGTIDFENNYVYGTTTQLSNAAIGNTNGVITNGNYVVISAVDPGEVHVGDEPDLVVNFVKMADGSAVGADMANLTVALVPTVNAVASPITISKNTGKGQYTATSITDSETVEVKVNDHVLTTFEFAVGEAPDTTIYVDALDGADGGSGTSDDPYHKLDTALSNVEDGGVIKFLEGTYDFYDAFYTTKSLSQNVVFTSDGNANFTGRTGLFNIASVCTVTFNNINFVDIDSSNGAVVNAKSSTKGTLNFNDCNFINNKAKTLIYSSCDVNFERCNFIDNTLEGTSTSTGGGIVFYYYSNNGVAKYCNFIGNQISAPNQVIFYDWDQTGTIDFEYNYVYGTTTQLSNSAIGNTNGAITNGNYVVISAVNPSDVAVGDTPDLVVNFVKMADGSAVGADMANLTVTYVPTSTNTAESPITITENTGTSVYTASSAVETETVDVKVNDHVLTSFEFAVTAGATLLDPELTVPATLNVNVSATESIGASRKGDGEITYVSSDESIATVDADGVVTGVGEGTATITVNLAAATGYTADSKDVAVTVSKNNPNLVVPETLDVKVNGEESIGATTASDATITYSSSDESVAIVDADGKVTGVSEGTATITVSVAATTAYTADSKDVAVTVSKNSPNLVVPTTPLEVEVNGEESIGATTDSDATILYVSSDESVATVDADGKVTGVSEGTATITVSVAATDAYDADSKDVTVNVIPPVDHAIYVDGFDGTGGSGTSDDPYHSLKKVLVTDATTNSGKEIKLLPGTYNFGSTTLNLYSYDFTLTATDAGVIFTSTKCLFQKNRDGSLTFNGIEFSGITSGEAAVYKSTSYSGTAGTLTFNNCTFINNKGTTLIQNTGNLNIVGCTFINNHATGVGTYSACGLINNYDGSANTIDISYSVFLNNQIDFNDNNPIVMDSSNTPLPTVNFNYNFVDNNDPLTDDQIAYHTTITSNDYTIITVTAPDTVNVEDTVDLAVNFNKSDGSALDDYMPTLDVSLVTTKNVATIPVTITNNGGKGQYTAKSGASYTEEGSVKYGDYVLTTFTFDVAGEGLPSPELTVPDDLSVEIGKTADIGATQVGTGTISYVSSDENVATVDDDGTVHGVSEGTATITVSVEETATHAAESKEVPVAVTKVAPSIEVTPDSLEIKAGTTAEIAVTSDSNGAVSYVSSDDSVATVDADGKVTAVASGTATITVSVASEGDYAAGSKDVTVSVLKDPQLSVPATLTLTVGDNGQWIDDSQWGVTTKESPGALSYYSHDSTIASVNTEGKLKAVSAGTVNVTVSVAKYGDYADDSKNITVTVKAAPVSPNLVAPETLEVEVDKTVEIGATQDGTATITYESNDTTVATVDENGVVTGIKEGKAKITVSVAANDDYLAESKDVTVIVVAAPVVEPEYVSTPTVDGSSSVEFTKGTDGVSVTVTIVSDKLDGFYDPYGDTWYVDAYVDGVAAGLELKDASEGSFTFDLALLDDKFVAGNVYNITFRPPKSAFEPYYGAPDFDKSVFNNLTVTVKAPVTPSYDYESTPSPATVDDYVIGDDKIITVTVVSDYLSDLTQKSVYAWINGEDANSRYLLNGVKGSDASFTFNLADVASKLQEGINTITFHVTPDDIVALTWSNNYMFNALTVNATKAVEPPVPATPTYNSTADPATAEIVKGETDSLIVTVNVVYDTNYTNANVPVYLFIGNSTEGIVIENVKANDTSFTVDLVNYADNLAIGDNTITIAPAKADLDAIAEGEYNFATLTVSVSEAPVVAEIEYNVTITDPASATIEYKKGNATVKIMVATTYDYTNMSALGNTKMYAFINGASEGVLIKSSAAPDFDVPGSALSFGFYLTQFDEYLNEGENTIIFHPDESYYAQTNITKYNYQTLTVNVVGDITPVIKYASNATVDGSDSVQYLINDHADVLISVNSTMLDQFESYDKLYAWIADVYKEINVMANEKTATVDLKDLSDKFGFEEGQTYTIYFHPDIETLNEIGIADGEYKFKALTVEIIGTYTPEPTVVYTSTPKVGDKTSIDYTIGNDTTVTVTVVYNESYKENDGFKGKSMRIFINGDKTGIVISDVKANATSFTINLADYITENGEYNISFGPEASVLSWVFYGVDNYVVELNNLTVNAVNAPVPVDAKTNYTITPASSEVDYVIGEAGTVTVNVEYNATFADALGEVDIKVVVNDGLGEVIAKANATSFELDLATLGLVEGINNITFAVESDLIDNLTINPLTVNVVKAAEPVQEMTLDVSDKIDVSEDANINMTLPADATGKYSVILDGEEVIVDNETATGGLTSVDLGKLPAGLHVVEVKYSGDEKYPEQSKYQVFTVDKLETPIEIEISEPSADNVVTVTVTLPVGADGLIIIDVNGTKYTFGTDIENTQRIVLACANVNILRAGSETKDYTFEIELNKPGLYDISATYVGNDYYKQATSETKIVAVESTPEPETNITVIVDGKEYNATVVDGKITVDTNRTEPEMPSSVVVDGVEYPIEYVNGTATVDTNATAPVIPIASEFTEITIADDQSISIVLKDGTGKVIANAPVKYAVNGVATVTTTDANGKFTIKGESGAVIAINYAGNENILGINTTLTLNSPQIPTVIKVLTHFNIPGGVITLKGYAVDTKAGEEGMYYSTELLDILGNPVKDVKIQFAVNDKIYNRTTKENGSFTPYKLNMVRAGRYTMAFFFAGDDNYAGTFGSVCVDLDKKPIKIKASAKTLKANSKSKYTITLSTIVGSSHDGKAHLRTGKIAKLTVNGKTYTGKTDKNGKVTFNIKNTKKGKFTATIFVKADGTYEEATKTVKLTFK